MHKKGYEETVLEEKQTKRTERKRATIRILKAFFKFYMKETGTDTKMGFGGGECKIRLSISLVLWSVN